MKNKDSVYDFKVNIDEENKKKSIGLSWILLGVLSLWGGAIISIYFF